MSEVNISSIVDGIEEIYRNNSRNGVSFLLPLQAISLTTYRRYFNVDEAYYRRYFFPFDTARLLCRSTRRLRIGPSQTCRNRVRSANLSYPYLHTSYSRPSAAHFIQETITTYGKHYAELSDSPTDEVAPEGKERGKECSNLIVLISELYNFQVISCVLLFDVVRSLLEGRLTEMDVELLLKILRSE